MIALAHHLKLREPICRRNGERLLNSQKRFQHLGCPHGSGAAFSSISGTLQTFTKRQLLPFISVPQFTLSYSGGTWPDGVDVRWRFRN
jgi:hypothetical protein